MGKYVLTADAQNDIKQISACIQKDSPKHAVAVVQEIRHICRLIGDMPGMGHVIEDVGADELYHFPAGKYPNNLIFYIVENDLPVIVRVIHAARDLPTFFERLYSQDE